MSICALSERTILVVGGGSVLLSDVYGTVFPKSFKFDVDGEFLAFIDL